MEEEQFIRLRLGSESLRHVFDQLRTIRTWGVTDRLRRTGLLEEWRETLAVGNAPAPFEVELWYRGSETARSDAAARVRRLVELEGGEVVSESTIPEIRYQALVGRLPRSSVAAIVETEDSHIVVCDDIMFLRPIGQVDWPPSEESEIEAFPADQALPSRPPLVALLDGLPLENHELLRDRLTIDDPDGWGQGYLAVNRRHGTAMASLILHGDLQEGEGPTDRLVYVRPILQPDPDWHRESAPIGQTFPDVVHRAVRRRWSAKVRRRQRRQPSRSELLCRRPLTTVRGFDESASPHD